MVQKAGLRILGSFKRENTKSFVEICNEAGYPTDLGGYYLRQLIDSGYLTKGGRGEYVLTPKGREYITSEHIRSISTPRIHVLVIGQIDGELVILERLQQPFLKRKEWPATAIGRGENLQSAVDRLLEERLSSADSVELKGIFRRLDYYQDELFDDKIFFVHSAKMTDAPIEEVVNGQNILVKLSALEHLKNKSRSLLDIYASAKDESTYVEKIYNLEYADFDPDA